MSKVANNKLGDRLDHDLTDLDMETLAIRSGLSHSPEREHSEPIFLTSSFVFDSAEQAAALFSGEQEGNIYSRFTNPTVNAFETRLGTLEGADYCVATASGMAAITGLVLSQLKPGDNIVASKEMFGSTVSLFNNVFNRFDMTTTFVPIDNHEAWAKAIKPNTRMLFVETPSNPLCQLADIKALAELAQAHDVLLVVDNCFCTPVLQQPLALGADVVIHTATKYLDGQGRCVGGAMATNNAQIHDAFFSMLRTTGPTMSPFNAWVFLKGLETLPLRMAKHCDNARQLAKWLVEQEEVEAVFYPGLKSHPQYDLAARQQRDLGGIVSFCLKGGKAAAWRVINQTRLLSITANLGDAKTTITHPATTTHARITQKQRDDAGVSDNLIRVSSGLESVKDIICDIERGLVSIGV